ncbi:TPA: hypothetical protein KEY68_003523 [Providencia rettgeri]|nr:hypothetical protein [Providencia rettgeri]
MLLNKYTISLCIILAMAVFLSYIASDYIKYDSIVNIVSVLQNISSIVFAIVGVWVAYLYPKLITEIINNKEDDFFDSKSETKKMESLIITIIISALVLIGVIVFYLLVLFMKGSQFYINNLEVIKISGVSFVFMMVIMQIFCIISVIINNVSFVNKLYKLLNDKELDNKL